MNKNIRDIAREAGVSVATVSKVINHYPHVSAKTREKVQRIIHASRFMPKAAARELVSKRSMTLGLLVPTSFKHPFFHQVFIGAEEALKESEYDMIYLAQVSWEEGYSVVQHCRSRNVDGVLIFGFQQHDLNLCDLLQTDIPAMFIDMNMTSTHAGFIMSDHAASIREAVHYLFKLGHRRIAYLSGMNGSHVERIRFDAYRQSLAECGIAYDPRYYTVQGYTKDDGILGMRELLQTDVRPTALICSSDLSAIGAIEAAKDAGFVVPDDLSIIGFDDVEAAVYCSPALTTIRQDSWQIGYRALQYLVELIQKPNTTPPAVILPTELVIRSSCAKAKGK